MAAAAAGARSAPERSGCDGETGADDFMRFARLATAAGGDRPRAANHFGMHRFPQAVDSLRGARAGGEFSETILCALNAGTVAADAHRL